MLTSNIYRQLEQALNYSAVKHKTVAQNIANVDTPNYKSKSVEFRTQFDHSLQAHKTDPKHIPFTTEASANRSYTIRTNNDTSFLHNGNNVDVDKEMSSLAENQLYYQALIQRMNGKMNSIKMVVKGGR
ncbi:flagellar basal body rod protein FlgB [Alkalihalobacillus sp. AL-G]|uniref:flagellar basal body rod protein FlgB n=1 Tax=Alkalihalobacillus sp. AL-G TaxID=2926399 RepID=UPI00272D7AED|nr:flagellar basal body rod protein FlgB [Alkalihalobacillus sp. AL-G]WLD95147.1 flagellar basal body rod protein FlgB [Alkalihalobacillus sp. AL-G]